MGKERLSRDESKTVDLAPPNPGDFPRRERSKRRIRCKGSISKQKKKLDSEAFECHVEKLWNNISESKRSSFSYLGSLWFSLYMKKNFREKVLTWIKKEQIFLKKYVLVPIVYWSHWYLLIFCNFGENLQSKTRTPCILLLDSLEKADPRRLEPNIRKFVLDIYRAEGRPETKEMIYKIPLLVPEVPQQRDDVECGYCVLYFLKLFMEGAPENFSIKDYPYFMGRDWFSPESLDLFSYRLES